MYDSLLAYLKSGVAFENDEVVDAFVQQFSDQFQESLVAVVFYGSCMRTKEYQNALLDFYVVVNNYRSAYQGRWYAVLNKVLPPNVFFAKAKVNNITYQAKFAVISQADLQKRTALSAFHPYFWARFMQPIAIVYSRTEEDIDWLCEVQKQAAMTFYSKTYPLLEGHVSSRNFWENGLRLTYATELRAESAQRAQVLYDADSAFYDYYSQHLFAMKDHFNQQAQANNLFRLQWKLRIIYGKYISILRLLKATQTFVGGVDYIAWKIHRHTGDEIKVSNNLRKYPWLFCWPLLLRLFIKGKVR